MDTLRMAPNKFTLLLLALLILFAVLVRPAQARNEYLNSYSNACQYGSVDLSTSYSQDDTDYRHYSPSNDYDNFSDRKELRLSFRKYLGVSKKMCDEQNKVLLENENLRQELEMLKVCQKYADRPLPPQFATVEKHCKGLRARPVREKSEDPLWDEMKKDYLKANPKADVYNPPKDSLKIPTDKQMNGPLPEPKN
jgi:hypothetical protein